MTASITRQCRALTRVRLPKATVVSDDHGSVRITDKHHGRSHDAVAVAGVLTVGAMVQAMGKSARRALRSVLVG
ncbi:MAG: hypothetical protein OXH67_14425 [Acidimicrobiaceae bacterium]|nr:hypothetical protein [Acidimicrobiaceae bacterium]